MAHTELWALCSSHLQRKQLVIGNMQKAYWKLGTTPGIRDPTANECRNIPQWDFQDGAKNGHQ